MSARHYLAVDLGAESGRVMLGTLAEGKLALEEIYRFPNVVVKDGGHLYWDLARLEKEIFAGLEKAGERGLEISGISADSWGVDYVLLDQEGDPLARAYCYRDSRTEKSPARVFAKIDFPAIYAETGIQFMAINTLYQLEAEQHDNAAGLAKAASFLNIADYFNARFSGVKRAEQSLASTTQLYDPKTGAWSEKITKALMLPSSLFPKIVPSGTVLGPVIGQLKKLSALAQAKVVATCSHDTGAAVAAVPASGDAPWAYLSSGTWSLLGVESKQPIMTEQAREAGFTNEAGLGGTTRLLKNLAGLWIVQECRRTWEAEGKSYNYDEITRMAVESGPARAHISLHDPRFPAPGDMPAKVAAFCRETGQPVPESPGQIVRTVLESLALTYAQTIAQLEKIIGQKIERLHIVGGGTRNDLLNQLAADATGLTVITGPVEATAIGNILIQALALGQIDSAQHLRRIVSASFPTRTFSPGKGISDEVRARFQKLQPPST